jgi:hypothetical protein
MTCAEAGDCTVGFDAFFGKHALRPNGHVEIAFRVVAEARMAVIRADRDDLGRPDYDWSAVLSVPKPRTGDELADWLARYDEAWRLTTFCPNPYFYEIEQSPWAASYGTDTRHYLVAGVDSYVEVVCKGFDWRS